MQSRSLSILPLKAVFLTVVLAADCTGPQLMAAPAVSTDARPIKIDGLFKDWEGVVHATDDAGDAPNAELDLDAVSIQVDREFVHLLIQFNRELNIQGLNGTLKLLVDGDGATSTGVAIHGMPGVDLIVHFSPENTENPDRPRMGVGVASTTFTPVPSDPSSRVNHSNIGFLLAPTHAANRIECRMDRSASLPATPPLFQGSSLRVKLVLVDSDDRVTDETDVISHPLPSATQDGDARSGPQGLPTKDVTALRVMAWNVEFGKILKEPDISARILKALNPDVLLLEEMTDEDSAATLERFLNSRVSNAGARPWQVLFGEGGGRLRCAIASRFPIQPVVPLARLPYPDWPDHQVRTVGGAITVRERTLLFAPIHLKCCGRIGSEEDKRRMVEVQLINRAVRTAIASDRFDGVLIGGDLNLVGGYDPLKVLGTGLDLDQTDLTILHPYHLDGRNNTTWANPAGLFVPGRLDYLLLSDSVLQAVQSFVFDSADLPNEWLSNHSMLKSDSKTASDHFPIVADLVWKE